MTKPTTAVATPKSVPSAALEGSLQPLSGSLLNILASVTSSPAKAFSYQQAPVGPPAESSPLKSAQEAKIESAPSQAENSRQQQPASDPAPNIPLLPLAPIVTQQPTVPTTVSGSPARVDSEDPGLYELSGVTLDSNKLNKVGISRRYTMVL